MSARAAASAPRGGGELVIFDCDGVLVDSEPIAIAVLVETIAAHGVRIGQDAAYRDFLGRTLPAVSAALAADYGVDLDAGALEAMRGRLYGRYREALLPMPGIIEALDRLGRPACVASSSVYERIEISLKLTGLYDRFAPNIFSAAMVPRGKPAPDLFLHAAGAMGFAPQDCVVVEDSPAGVMAAKAAGMRVFAFIGGGHIGPAGLERELGGLAPDAMFDDLRALPDLLSSRQKTRTRHT